MTSKWQLRRLAHPVIYNPPVNVNIAKLLPVSLSNMMDYLLWEFPFEPLHPHPKRHKNTLSTPLFPTRRPRGETDKFTCSFKCSHDRTRKHRTSGPVLGIHVFSLWQRRGVSRVLCFHSVRVTRGTVWSSFTTARPIVLLTMWSFFFFSRCVVLFVVTEEGHSWTMPIHLWKVFLSVTAPHKEHRDCVGNIY